jgi:hypothetical protein
MSERRSRIYVAGPYTRGDVCLNVRAAVHAADQLLTLGYAPLVPHLTHLWHTISPHDYEEWLTLDLAWLAVCDAVLRLPGDSPGADRECAEAVRLGIPVYHDLETLKNARN